MERGNSYLKLYRKILKWGWYSDGNTFRVFIHILLNANWDETEYRGYKLHPGDCVFGRKKWAKELGMSEQNIRTAINHLKSTNEITTKVTNKFTIITVEKWGFWQVEEGKLTNEVTNKLTNDQPTTNQQLTTHIERKNIRKEEVYIYSRVVDYLNEKVGSKYKSSSRETQKHISARLNEGYTVDDFIKVIDKKCNEWLGTELAPYLRPTTLFGTKFESYLNAPERKNDANKNSKDGSGTSEAEAVPEGWYAMFPDWDREQPQV